MNYLTDMAHSLFKRIGSLQGGRSLWAAQSGTALIEFAAMLPVFLLIIFGTYEMHRYVSANHKLETAAFQLVDMVTNQRSVTNASLDRLMESADLMISPFSPTGMRIIITSIVKPNDAEPVAVWQRVRPSGATGSRIATGAGSQADIPLALEDRDQILAIEIFYPYKTTFGIGIDDAFLESEDVYKLALTRPRYGTLVDEP